MKSGVVDDVEKQSSGSKQAMGSVRMYTHKKIRPPEMSPGGGLF